jgi:hypothetical protein
VALAGGQQEGEDRHHEDRHHRVLSFQEGERADANGIADGAHCVVAGIVLEDAHGKQDRGEEPEPRAPQHNPDEHPLTD